MRKEPSPIVERVWLARARLDGTFDLDKTLGDYADVKCLYRMRLFRVAQIALNLFWEQEGDNLNPYLLDELEGYLQLAEQGMEEEDRKQLMEGLG